MKESKTNDSRQKAGYNSPSVRVVDIKTKTAILSASVDSLTTETEDGGNLE